MKASILIFSLALFFLFLHSQALTKPHRSNETDRDALLSFKSHVTDDPKGALANWNRSTSLCEWQGVLCSTKRTRVTGLALGNFSITGTITPDIGNLSFLRILDLENNNFHGSIPSDIGKLFRLDTLILASNKIEGRIPLSLSECSSLRLLDLSANRLEGTIPSALGNLSKLEDLSFAKNNLTGYLPLSFANLSSLNNLILMYNKLEGPLPSEIGRLNLLVQINIGENKFSGQIPSSVFNLSSLLILGVAKNRFSGHLPSDLFTTLPNLWELYLGGNLFEGKIPSSLSNATQLQVVDFSVNQLTGGIPLLWNLKSIRILNLEFNQFENGENGLKFITSLTNSSKLEVFSVGTNRFSGEIPSSIGNLSSQIALLNLVENKFEGNIPETIGNLGSLIQLSMEANSFTGRIPSSIGSLKYLQGLSLHLNLLSGEIPESIGNLTQLYELRLNENNLIGRIPSSLSRCRNLQFLDLSANGLNGSIPKKILTFPSLSMLLNLSSNSLTGNLPSEVGKLKMVQGLDFSKNKLSGSIPSSLGECTSILYLDISRNSFQGVIPSSLGNLKGIESIDLSSNNLSGQIPPLAGLKYLKFLNLSKNKLQGEVPKQGIFSNTSGVFLRENAELCGGIPELGLRKCSVETDHRSKSKHALVIGLVVGSTMLSVSFLLLLYLIYFMKRKTRNDPPVKDAISFDGLNRSYSYYDLKSATSDFSESKLIGSGSFGLVYEGILRDGRLAAIKVFNMEQHRASKSFLAECEALRNIRHRNLVKILGVCSTPTFKALVLQFMTNGSLEKWLHSKNEVEQHVLTLEQRLEIATDVASAMEYLHHDCETPLAHCDLKPSNVLLDEDMTAHVADFGLARMLRRTDFNAQISSTIGLKGSVGYIAPEYGYGAQVTVKGDVYSYGILLLELLSGKRPTDELFSGELNLQKWVQAALPDRILEVLDEELVEACIFKGVHNLDSLLKVGLFCTNEAPDTRPQMKDVSAMIHRIRDTIRDTM